MGTPFVSIIMPIRNEAVFIARSLGAVLAQDYPHDRMEVLIADGMSTDNTREIVLRMQNESDIAVRLLDNFGQIAPSGLNTAFQHAQGDIIVRVDGHCVIEADYVARCVECLLEKEVEGVGGPIETIGENALSRTIALAMSSKFGVGGSAFRTVKGREMIADTVAFPAYTRKAIMLAGLFDEELVRNQDDEYNYRLRERGGKILLSPTIKSQYFSRSSIKALWRQYYQYGYWKVRVMQKHPRQMQARQFAPPAFAALLIVGVISAPLLPAGRQALKLISLAYLAANIGASTWLGLKHGLRHMPFLPIIFAMLHLGYGFGFLSGLFAFRNRWGDKAEKPTNASLPIMQQYVDE